MKNFRNKENIELVRYFINVIKTKFNTNIVIYTILRTFYHKHKIKQYVKYLDKNGSRLQQNPLIDSNMYSKINNIRNDAVINYRYYDVSPSDVKKSEINDEID